MRAWMFKGWRIMRYSMWRFIEDGCIYRASALTFNTLLSLVPLLAISFTVASSFPQSDQLAQAVRDFLFTNFIVVNAQEIESYFVEFAQQIHHLSDVGVLFLMVTAILTLFTIEQALNEIWRVRERRRGLSAFLMYWAVLTLIPILLVLSLAISSYLVSIPLLNGTMISYGLDHRWVLAWLPTLFTLIIFFMLYFAVPNCRVKGWHAWMGAGFATAMLALVKWGFVWYLGQFNTYQLIYGAFATIPIFLLWLHAVWFIILLGAEIAYACSLENIKHRRVLVDPFTQAYVWLRTLWTAQEQGVVLTPQTLVAEDRFTYAEEPTKMIDYFIAMNFVRFTAKEGLVLTRDLHRLSFGTFRRLLPWRCPTAADLSQVPTILPGLQHCLDQSEQCMAHLDQQSLASLMIADRQASQPAKADQGSDS